MSEEKRAKIISMIRDTIREAEPTAQIILYGSRARGDAREDSDWDVLAIVDKPRLTLEERGNIQYPIWDKGLDMGEEINVFPYTKKQWDQAPPSLFKPISKGVKQFRLMLPIQIKDVVNEYVFIFDVEYEYNHPERLTQ